MFTCCWGGGQMKRLSVGVEIMQPPALLLLDEVRRSWGRQGSSSLPSLWQLRGGLMHASRCLMVHCPVRGVCC